MRMVEKYIREHKINLYLLEVRENIYILKYRDLFHSFSIDILQHYIDFSF